MNESPITGTVRIDDSVEIPEVVPIRYTTYVIEREIVYGFTGRSFLYFFLRNDECLFSSKAKERHPSSKIPIKIGNDVHIGIGGEYSLFSNSDSREFVLKQTSCPEFDLFRFEIINVKSFVPKPRQCRAIIYPVDSFPTQMILTTKPPQMTSKGTFVLDFHDRFTIPSEKNSIFVYEKIKRNSPEVASVRKIGRNHIEIIIDERIPPVIAFSLGLCLLVGDLHPK